MNLSQCLKLKNRLAGELVRQQSILQRENVRRSDNPSKVNQQEVWDKIIQTSDALGQLKGKISAANVEIYPEIERMAEYKSRISYLQSLPKRDGEEVSFVGRDQEKLIYNWKSFINQETCDKMVAELQTKCDLCQDNIDKFNSVTNIDFAH